MALTNTEYSRNWRHRLMQKAAAYERLEPLRRQRLVQQAAECDIADAALKLHVFQAMQNCPFCIDFPQEISVEQGSAIAVTWAQRPSPSEAAAAETAARVAGYAHGRHGWPDGSAPFGAIGEELAA